MSDKEEKLPIQAKLELTGIDVANFQAICDVVVRTVGYGDGGKVVSTTKDFLERIEKSKKKLNKDESKTVQAESKSGS